MELIEGRALHRELQQEGGSGRGDGSGEAAGNGQSAMGNGKRVSVPHPLLFGAAEWERAG
jgi:hypothetical protein